VLYSLFFIISWKYFGFHMILMLAGLQQIPKRAERGGVDRRGLHVGAIPLRHPAAARPTVRVSVFLSIIGALQLFDIVWVTTKGGPIGASSTMATYLYDQFRAACSATPAPSRS
jgi:raffinose/stachyose/melibiose transport system permease protein